MEGPKVDEKIEREAVGVEFSNSMQTRDHENCRRGGVRINQADIFATIESCNLSGMSVNPKEKDEIVTDSDSDSSDSD